MMKQRCLNPNCDDYKYYGGRGITICKEWKNDFQAFYKYMGDVPFKGAELDRVDNDGNYAPGNVRWATRSAQEKNKRKKKGMSSKYKHVHWSKVHKKWRVQINITGTGRNKHVGAFKTELAAHRAAKKYLRENL